MKRSRNGRLVWAAMAAASLISVPAMAQIRAGQDGHANDSSNRVGSGGYNAPGSVYNNGITPNQIIYGNVTGGLQFQGPHERDPRSFTGFTGSTVADQFTRGTTGVPTAYQPASPQYAPQLFFGASRNVAPPTGTQPLGYTGSYVSTGGVPVGPMTSLPSEVAASGDILRQRSGDSAPIGVRTTLLNPETGDLNTAPTGEAILSPSSPLFGLQGLPGEAGNDNSTDLPGFAPPSLTPGGTDRFRMQRSDLERLRSELSGTPNDQGNAANGTTNDSTNGQTNNGQQTGTLQSSSLSAPADGPAGSGLNPQQPGDGIGNGNLTNNVGGNLQGQQQRSTLVPARVPGSQGNVLRQRLDQYLTPQMRALRDSAQYVNRMAQIRNKAATPGGPTSRPSMGAGPLETGTPGGAYAQPNLTPGASPALTPGVAPGQPVKINSLADGVSAKGLHDLLKSAEDLMRQDKFQSALDKYDAAQQVAPHDTLIALGRANAELGAGFYHHASADLHTVFLSDPALLMGQYNLKNWMSEKRLEYITRELSDLAAAEPKSEDPVFLLAYVSFNTGDAAKAADYLKQARARAGNKDDLLDQLDVRWRPAGASATPDLNK